MSEQEPVKPLDPKRAAGSQKPSLSCVPFRVLFEIGSALAEGAHKYGFFNWRKPGQKYLASTYYNAALRHLASWWEGEDIDPDSELSHITKAISSLVVLRDAMLHGSAHDDRPTAVEIGWLSKIKIQGPPKEDG